MNRRTFIGMLAVGLTAITGVFAEAEKPIILYGDGKHDDHDALQAWADGKKVASGGYGKVDGSTLVDMDFRLNRPIYLRAGDYRFLNCQIYGANHLIIERGSCVTFQGSLPYIDSPYGSRFTPKDYSKQWMNWTA